MLLRTSTDLPAERGVAVALVRAHGRIRAVASWGDDPQRIEMALWLLVLGAFGSGET